MAVTITINGVDTLKSKLNKMVGVNTSELVSAIGKGAQLVRASAVNLCPVDTGALRGSIHTKPVEMRGNEVVGTVYTSKEYATYVEFGTGVRGNGSYPYETSVGLSYGSTAGQVAQPYMTPALRNRKGDINRLVAEAVAKAAKKG